MMNSRSLNVALLSAAWFCAGLIHAAPTAALPDRVVILRNTSSPVSRAIADDYAQRRGVANILDIATQDAALNANSETITLAKFRADIETPLRAFLANHTDVDFIVLTKGIPIRITGAQSLPSSLDSYLAALDYDKLPGAIRVLISDPGYGPDFHGAAWANRFWNSKKRFSHAEFGGYLVTRLDAYTQAEAIALTTKSLQAEAAMLAGQVPNGPILLDEDPGYGRITSKANQPFSVLKENPPVRDTARIVKESVYGGYNADMQLAADTLKARKLPYTLDTTNVFKGHVNGLMGYISWGSNDGHYDSLSYVSLGFNPGAIAETAVSTGARTFLPASGGQSLIADLIHKGVTGIKGYSDEPLLQAVALPSILYARYTAGWTLAESYYAASNLVGWEDIVIGDPLCRAYPSDSSATGLQGFPRIAKQNTLSVRQIGNQLVLSIPATPGVTRVSLSLFSPQGKYLGSWPRQGY